MSKEIYISSTPHETRLAIVEKDELTEIYYERENEYTLAGSIYNGKVTRVLPGMQSSFVDIGLERDAFLYITDFMEEAGDAADFEGAGSGGGRSQRPRENSRVSEGSRVAESSRPGDEARRDEAPAAEAGRSQETGRGRSRRGRGDRDRRRQAPLATTPVEAGSEAGGEEFDIPLAVYDGASETADLTPPQADHEDAGEGAPGADGARRWRGRRGRRRGRGASDTAGAGDAIRDEIQVTPLRALDAVGEESVAEPLAGDFQTGEDAAAVEPRSAAAQPGRERGRGRRGRDRRDRDRNERQAMPDAVPTPVAAPQNDRHTEVRERFAPRDSRGQRGSRDVRGPRTEEPREQATSHQPEPEPFILPGESLSKYRKGEAQTEGSTPRSESIAAARPSTEVQPLVGWDGGAVLPGETLSRRTGPAPSSERGGRPVEAGGRDRRRDRDERRGRGGREERSGESRKEFSSRRLDPSEAVQPAVTTGHDIEPTQSFVKNEASPQEHDLETQHTAYAEEVYASPTTDQYGSLPEAGLAVSAVGSVDQFHETVTEYEPGEDASASYRVDPAPPREFRQSAGVEDSAQDFAEEELQPAGPTHEVTSVTADGGMHSEAGVADVERQAHVAAGLEAGQLEIGQMETGQPEDGKRFAPGHGALEEELIDDEDAEPLRASAGTVHAGAAEDTDEEVMEHAADLGSILRDMSIDDITRPEQAELAEDDDDGFDIDEEEMEEDELAFEEGAELVEDPALPVEEQFAANGPGAETATAENGQRRREGGRRGRRDGRRGRDRGERPDSERGAGERQASERQASERQTSERQTSERQTSERPADEPATGERSGGERDRGNGERSFGERGGSRDRRGMANGRGGRSGGRHSAQATDLPAISDLLKPGQEVLVQIAKEPIAKKGARITSHIALPGRFLVFMPTVHHTGVSRKIESDGERRRLKEILLSERGDASGGFIVRTAAQGASEEELRSDLRFLLNLWADIKARSESSKSPALIYHDLNLVERILRDQVTDNFSAIWVDTEVEYERVVRFLQRFQPALVRRVKLYGKDTPLFEQFGITEEINKALRSKVWLKSGGSIVINQTEALVAIDINTGKYVGKTARLEDTIVKTNLDAIPEIVRQIRLRDLGGIIIIDFIDMDERKNRNRVMAALEEELKSDRAPSKVLQFNDFGLVAITRKRVKQSLERTLSTTCGVCAGTGMVKSPVTVCNDIYVEMRKMHKVIEKGDIMLRVNPEVVKQLKTGGAKWLQEMEEMSGKTILVKSDPSLHPEQFDIH